MIQMNLFTKTEILMDIENKLMLTNGSEGDIKKKKKTLIVTAESNSDLYS